MKSKRHVKILELIQKNDIETQEELLDYLNGEGYRVTQATVSRDIRELKLTKVAVRNGRQKYAVLAENTNDMMERDTLFLWMWPRIFWWSKLSPVWQWQLRRHWTLWTAMKS